MLRAATSGALGLAAIATATTLDTEPAAADVGSTRRCAAGTWTFVVAVPGRPGPPEESLYALTADGVVIHVSNNGLIGLGNWQATATNRFVIAIREWLTDFQGVVEGSIHVRLDCMLTSAGTVTGNGTVKGFDLNGNQNFSGSSTAVGTKFGIED
jgi:hypothetical protein